MRAAIHTLIVCLVCSLGAPAAPAQRRRNNRQPVAPDGLYSSMQASAESGDVGGMEVMIITDYSAEPTAYYAVVQTAQGVPGTPVLVRARVRGENIEFTLPAEGGDQPVRYSGMVTAAGLRLKDSYGESRILRRMNCR